MASDWNALMDDTQGLDPPAIDPVTRALAGAFRRSPIAMVVFSASGVIEHINDAMARVVGVSADLLVGRTADSVVHPDDVDMIGRFAQFDSDREPVELDHRVIRSDGEVSWLRSSVVALQHGDTHSFFVQSIDHTTSRRRDIELRSIDIVTGLLSRDGLMAKLEELVATRDRQSFAPYTLLAVDIDDFRGMNDRLGSIAADRALFLVGACIRAALPVGVYVARVGADVFIVLLPGMDVREANVAAEHLLGGLDASVSGRGLPALGYKLGAVVVRDRDVDPADAVRLVEQRAHDPVTASEALVVGEITSSSLSVGSLPAASLAVSEWGSAVESAIAARSYIAVGEPLRMMHRGLAPLERYELFVRLVLPDHKWVSLPKFEPYAQHLGRGTDVDRWMVTFAVGMLKSNPNLELEVNVSAVTLGDATFVDHVADEIRSARVDPAHLLLAVTERDVADDVRQALTFSEAVCAIGVGICLDEHGSVADGVRYLSLIGAKRVKLTSQYVRGAKQSSSDRAMIGILARAARELGIEVAAPFVTDDGIFAILAAVGVDLAQGRLIGHAARITLPE